MRRAGLALLTAASLAGGVATAAPRPLAAASAKRLPPGVTGWRDSGAGGIRGITIGPIESGLHPNKGYGSPACARTMNEVSRVGGNWVSLTPFGRMRHTDSSGIDLTFETPFAQNEKAVRGAVAEAHAAGLRVLLVPHLWVETGDWRGRMDPGDDAEWADFARSYRRFVLTWARVAEAAHVDMLSVGVELRSWVTTTRATSFIDIVRDVRGVYSGPLTYASNWDDVEDNVVLGELDVIGVNAFFPLSDKPGGDAATLRKGGENVATRMRATAASWNKPILLTEIGYTTRADPAFEPWIWPDALTGVKVDQAAQDEAYTALLAPLFDEDWFAGMFVWRFYADPDDMSQEAEWGFSPRGKLAELAVRDAFAMPWAADGNRFRRAAFATEAATPIGLY